MAKLFVIGDIHGCLLKLKNLMAGIEVDDRQDSIIFLGDYIDRGPESREVVEFIIDFKKSRGNVFCLMGNHEEVFIDYLKHGINKETFFINGGFSTLVSYNFPDVIEDLPESHLAFFASLIPYYETDRYVFVHAGLRPGIPLDQQEQEDLLWIRGEFIGSCYDFGKTVVFGHTHFLRPLIEVNKIGIDTGAVYGGKLTCMELPGNRIYQS
ncbi:MAG TPA: metallophosphoesterase family protein [Syntrophales bacterium]|nr:metallophosphoesterase family protein [Syntrophales bacterium]